MGEKIAILAEKDLYTLIKNTVGGVGIVKIDLIDDLFKEKNEEVECLILELKGEESFSKIEIAKELGIYIIAIGNNIEYRKIVEYIKYGKIDDYLDERDYYLIENILKEITGVSLKSHFLIREGTKASIISLDSINYIEYDGAKRKAMIVTDTTEYTSKTKLFELEQKLRMKPEIIKADKSTLINIRKIDVLQDEEVYFKNNRKKIFSRAIVRKIEYFISKRMAVEI